MFKALPNTLVMAGMVLPGDLIRYSTTQGPKYSEVTEVQVISKSLREFHLKEFQGEVWTGKTRVIRFHVEFTMWLLGTYNSAVAR